MGKPAAFVHRALTHPPPTRQISTTKGTGGDIIILEEAAYIDPGFFYETVAPLLIMGNTTLLAISTLTSEINFYTRLMKMRDKVTHQPIFTFLSVELACAACKAEGKASECVHMLHLVPRWQSADRHVKLKTIMQDRPDLIESELSGLAFDSLQQIFKPQLLDIMFTQPCPPHVINDDVHIFIDPAAGGPFSDYAVLSITRQKGLVTVSAPEPQRAQPMVVGVAHHPIHTQTPGARTPGYIDSGHEVGHAHAVHEIRRVDRLVLDPAGQETVVQLRVEARPLDAAHRVPVPRQGGAVLAQLPPRGLVEVQEHQQLDAQGVEAVVLVRGVDAQGLDHPGGPAVRPLDPLHRPAYDLPDELRVAAVEDVH